MHADTDAFVSALLIDTMIASSDGSVTPDGQHNFTSVSKKKNNIERDVWLQPNSNRSPFVGLVNNTRAEIRHISTLVEIDC